MNKIDTSLWKEFRIGELFPKIVKPPVLHSKEVLPLDTGIPYIVRTKFNNGIKFRVKQTEAMHPSPSGVITFGAENATFFYQEEAFVSGRDIYYIDTQNLTKNAALFVTACLQIITKKYSYSYGMFPDLVKKDTIQLPVSVDGKPDFAYMDSYMREIVHDSELSIKCLRQRDKQKRIIDIKTWKVFYIGDLFDISRPATRSQTQYEEGDIPFVASGNCNNGVIKWCKPKENEILDPQGCISVSPLDGSAFYQPKAFLGRGGAGSAILLLHNKNLTAMNGLFIATVLRCALTKFSYNDQINTQTILSQTIRLPITENGKPDYKYMEAYMCNITKESDSKLQKMRKMLI